MLTKSAALVLFLLMVWPLGVFAQEEDGWGFVPGDKLLLFDDFTDMPRGAAPPRWKVRGAAVRLVDGRLTVGAGSSTRMTPNITTWPDSFTVEMNVQAKPSAEDALRNITWVFENGDAWAWQATLTLHANGQCGAFVEIADPGENSRAACNWLPGETNNLALWIQDGRLRIYLNGQRIIDMNQLRLSFQTASLMVSADAIPVSFGAFRIAQSTADAGTPILAGESKGTQGIQSDINGVILKPKSNPLEIQKLDPNALRQPYITITTPKSGDLMATGSTYPISWQYQRDSGPVKIELAMASGGASLWIAPSVPLDGSGTGQYNWPIFENLSPANNYTIKITSVSNNALTATTGSFSIVRPFVTLTSPQQGATFPPGGNVPIKWSYAGNNFGDQLRVTATLEGGLSPSLDAMYVPIGRNGQGEYGQWISPASNDDQKFNIRIQSTQNPSIFNEVAIKVMGLSKGGTGGQTEANSQPSAIFGKTAESIVEQPTVSTGNSNVPLDIRKQLLGYVDLHTHPMSYLGFGRKAMFGGLDIGSLMPAGSRNCNKTPFTAGSIEEALGNCNSMHGGWGANNTCGDYIREGIINFAIDTDFIHRTSTYADHEHSGYPDFLYWPNQTSILHQQMWWEWIKRAYEGGLRVMVALTVNSELLAEIINGDTPYDDRTVADIQIDETIKFVNRHLDFMEIAYSAADLNRIISSNKLAVVLGMEVDKLGNFGKTGVATNESTVRAEIQRLYRKGIRYAFPIHLIDNSFGGTAVYDALFNFANKRANDYHFSVATSNDANITYNASLTDGPLGAENRLIFGIRGFLEQLAELPAPCFNDPIKCLPVPGKIRCCSSYEKILNVFNPSPELDIYKLIPGGHVNNLGITQLGMVVVNEMMKLGMMIDVDHMSESAMTRVIEIAENSGNYPILMGHNKIRESKGNERSVPEHLVKRIAALGGMFGVGTADITPDEFVSNYRKVLNAMGNGAVAIGTDVDGFEPLPKHMRTPDDITSMQFYTDFFNDSFIKTTPIRAKSGITGINREWDYIKEKGVAQYGLMPEFLFDAKTSAGGTDVIDNLMQSAEHFGQTWQRAEMISKSISGAPLAGMYSNSIRPVMNLCPSQLAGGDREFDGNGPKITGTVALQISPDGTNLQAVISFDAKETVSDWSEVKGNWTIDIGEPAPAGMRYSKINSPLVSTFERVLSGGGGNEVIDGCDGAENVIMPASGPVSSILVVGDTGGQDISADNDCTCDTRINRIDIKPVNATLVQR